MPDKATTKNVQMTDPTVSESHISPVMPLPAQDSMQQRPNRRTSEKRRDLPRKTMEIPARFNTMGSDGEYDDDNPTSQDTAFMHQSVLGVIAAAQSRDDFESILQQTGSEDESGREEDLVTGAARPEGNKMSPSSDHSTAHSRHRKRLSENKLVRSLPGLGSKHARGSSYSSSTPSPRTLPPRQTHGFREAPIMSQMLQAKANVEALDASTATPKAAHAQDSSSDGHQKETAPKALPDALREIFHFDDSEDVISEYPCWYLQNVLLQGYMYVTQRHICFYAYLQQKSNVTIKTGYLSKRGKTNPHYRRYWFTLKGTVLTYFVDPSTPYFPSGNIDLRYGISAEVLPPKEKGHESSHFTVTTDKRTYQFKADSALSAKEWVKQLQKIIFRTHNEGDSVKICLPIDNILDVEENSLTNFAETIRIRVIDNDETFAVDEYYFSFFSFGKDALKVLKIMSQDSAANKALAAKMQSPVTSPRLATDKSPSLQPSQHLSSDMMGLRESVRATVPTGPPLGEGRSRRGGEVDRRRSSDRPRASFDHPSRSPSGTRQVSHKPQLAEDLKTSQSAVCVDSDDSVVLSSVMKPGLSASGKDAAYRSDPSASGILTGSVVFRDPTLRPSEQRGQTPRVTDSENIISAKTVSNGSSRRASQDKTSPRNSIQLKRQDGDKKRLSIPGNTMPQGPTRNASYTDSLTGLMRASGSYPIQGAKDIAGLLRNQSKRVGTLLGTSPKGYYDKVYGMWAGGQRHYGDADALQGEDHVYDPDEETDIAEAEQRFRDYFALPTSEKLVATFFGHIMRVLPLYGKIYVGTTRLCFRSLLPGTRTKFVIPFKDILNVEKEKGFRFGYSGTVVVIRGHEEIFFEFNSAGLRDDCTVTILRSLDAIKGTAESVVVTAEEKLDAEAAARENLLLQEAMKDGYAEHELQLPRNMTNIDTGAPPILFDDPEASLIDFKPEGSLRITCLTIGSRGDVQPYIALCKGLLREGHRPKIATHAEFEPWVRKHGIDFAPVDGDPAELMRICVDNGMFTPSFLLEANTKFRVFLEQLLDTAWQACQDTDLLIESPSAMAGIHIAEALGIPYFRAFTMPWTRTRAYPHAFAVPNHKMGGAYNYMTYLFFDNVFWTSTAGQVNKWRKDVLGLRSTNLERLQQNKVPFLYNFSPSVVVPPLDFSDWIRVTGYWFLDEAQTWTPPEPLEAFIKKARKDKIPLVYIGFGSIVVADSKAMTQAIVSAVLKADVRCILSKGWSDRLSIAGVSEVPLPESIFQIQSAPHDWLFAQIDAAVHHGGCGTTGASLRAGVPTIIKPFFGDQFFNGNRVQDLGVGLNIKRISENVLGKALWVATHDQRMKDKAKILGEQIRSEDGVGTAIKCIYRDMEYAKTLIKKTDRKSVGSNMGDQSANEQADVEDEAEDEESWTFVENDSDVETLQPGWSGSGLYGKKGKQPTMKSADLGLGGRQ